ncbi:hypothetical protein [Aurantiacibacter luteus]|uniref:Uncharacterized protein n=1 Tax=Aurantiacibacter luteus TaxID=1581420 RepID=A0A0G9MZB3_9SPHN|nr:hypothetical protein [Aurantiacibacter luteus]KLE36045.1 hypothetical protein AAW00_02320 [Aurantiacibacter luteus]
MASPAAYAQVDAIAAQEAQVADNPEMAAIYAADQAARTGTAIDWDVVGREDEARRVRTREMLDAGELRTGADFVAAAFIFQHGGEPRDYLLAHVLGTHAVGLGDTDGRWIAAAALDRYLQATGAEQIYGTQYRTRPGEPVTMEPYDTALLPDAVRTGAQVPSLAQQDARREAIEAQVRAAMAGTSDGN